MIIPVLRILGLPELEEVVEDAAVVAVLIDDDTGGPVLATPRVQITLAPNTGDQ